MYKLSIPQKNSGGYPSYMFIGYVVFIVDYVVYEMHNETSIKPSFISHVMNKYTCITTS